MSRAELWAFMGVACAVAVIVALLLAGCQAPLRTASAEYLSQRLVRIESDDARQLKEFNHIDPALAALNAGDPGLILPHPLGNVGLP